MTWKIALRSLALPDLRTTTRRPRPPSSCDGSSRCRARLLSFALASALLLLTPAAVGATLAAPSAAAPSPAPGKLVRHVLLLAIASATPPDRLAAIEAAMEKLPSEVPDVVAGEWGRDLTAGARTQGYTHAFVVTFRDGAAIARYRSHPAHQAFVELTTPHLAKPPLVLDYVVD
jgi:hypothetical protein